MSGLRTLDVHDKAAQREGIAVAVIRGAYPRVPKRKPPTRGNKVAPLPAKVLWGAFALKTIDLRAQLILQALQYTQYTADPLRSSRIGPIREGTPSRTDPTVRIVGQRRGSGSTLGSVKSSIGSPNGSKE